MYDINKLLNVAESELGYLEKASDQDLDSKTGNAGSGNFTKYWRDLDPSMQGQSWCDAFVSWCFMRAFGKNAANELLCGGLNSYYTPTSANKYKKVGQFSHAPIVGDQVFFKNSQRICHTGIVVGVTSSTIITIEGNTSGASGVVPNGGGVKKKTYSRNYSGIAGYGHPNYGKAECTEDHYPRWIHDGTNWYYRLKKGENAHGWRSINRHRYYFNSQGQMLTGWQQIGDDWYYFQPEEGKGASLAGALYVSDKDGKQHILTE